jgi:hypothetical protein
MMATFCVGKLLEANYFERCTLTDVGTTYKLWGVLSSNARKRFIGVWESVMVITAITAITAITDKPCMRGYA